MLYDILDKVLTPQILVMVLAGISGFAAVMTLAMPALARDRVSGRMKMMATERDKMRANRIGELNKDKQTKLRTAPKGFMQQLVDQLNLRKAFDTDEVRDKLRMAGFRGESPRYAFVFFRFLLPILLFFGALIYFFVMRTHELPPIARLGVSMGIGYIGFYLPTMFLTQPHPAPPGIDQERVPRRPRPAADLRAVGHVGRSRVRQGRQGSRRAIDRACRRALADHGRAVLSAGSAHGLREPRHAYRHCPASRPWRPR